MDRLSRAAEIAAIVPGRTLQMVFGALGVVRPAPKPLHPSGRLRRVRVHRLGLPAQDRVGVPWIDEPGDSTGVVRFSRATGLPEWLPDIHGLAIRVEDGAAEGGHADLLLATTGLGRLTRFVLRPTRTPTGSSYSTLLPYRAAGGPVLVAATSDPADDDRLVLVVASGTGAWRVFADLAIMPSAEDSTGDTSISFDPILHQLDGLEQYPWVVRLREGAYRAARRTRGARHPSNA